MKKYKFQRKYKGNIFKPYTVETDNKYEIMQEFLESQSKGAEDLKGVQYIITIQKR